MEINSVNSINSSSITGFNTDSATKQEPAKSDNKNVQVDHSKDDIKLSKKELESAVDKANKVLFKDSSHLQFKIHEETHDVIIKIVNDVTGEVIKEIPPEKFVDMMAKICEVTGAFVNEKR